MGAGGDTRASTNLEKQTLLPVHQVLAYRLPARDKEGMAPPLPWLCAVEAAGRRRGCGIGGLLMGAHGERRGAGHLGWRGDFHVRGGGNGL